MIKSNTNMEETGELESPRPPEKEIIRKRILRYFTEEKAAKMRLIRDSMEAASEASAACIRLVLQIEKMKAAKKEKMEAAKVTRQIETKEQSIDIKWKKEKPKAVIALMDQLKNVLEKFGSLEVMVLIILANIDEILKENEKQKIKQLLILLFAFHLFCGNASNLEYQARPERGKIVCINVFLIGNAGAHAYNGNATSSKQTNSSENTSKQTNSSENTSLTDVANDYKQESPVRISRPRPSLRILMQRPTDRMLAVIAKKLDSKDKCLAFFLGISMAEIDQIKEDNEYAEDQILVALKRWRDDKEKNATIEILANAFEQLNINSDIFYDSARVQFLQ